MEPPFDRVLVTGAQGFTGKYLCNLLRRHGYKVFGVGTEASDKSDFYYSCDVANTGEMTKILERVAPHYVFHLAAISFVQHSNPSEIYQVNVLGTESLLQAILNSKTNPRSVLLASSATVYGDQPNEVLSEDLPPNPKNHYGISKFGMEQIAKNYFSKIPILLVRPFNYSGPGQSVNFVIPKIVHHFKTKLAKIELGNLDVFREFNDIEFVCKIYFELMLCGAHSQVVNVCSGQTYSLQEVINETTHLSGHQLDVVQNPLFVRHDEVKRLSGSTLKLKTLIKSIPETSLRKTLFGYFNSHSPS